jgi:hypothetical protein
VHERHFSESKITGGIGFKMLQKMGWGGDALGKYEDVRNSHLGVSTCGRN